MSDFKVLYSEDVIARRVAELGARITKDSKGETLDLVCLVDTGHVFMADLLRQIEVPVRTHFMSMSVREVLDPNYDRERHEIFFYPEINGAGRNIIVVDGVLQTGVTMDFLLRRIWLREPKRVKTCILVDKLLDRRVLLNLDYVGFELETADIIVGYGMAWNGVDGNLRHLASISREPAAVAAGGAKGVNSRQKKRKSK